MFNHTKVYKNHFDIYPNEHHYCEVCGLPATGGIHHLEKRGEGKDIIELLMGLCSKHHNMCEDSKDCNEYAKKIHAKFILINPYQHPEQFKENTFKLQNIEINSLYDDFKVV
jgi:hypothetical protein